MAEIFWTEARNDLEGSRWDIWEKYYQTIIDWNTFKDRALVNNNNINRETKWLFIKGWRYIMPTMNMTYKGVDVQQTPNFDDPKERNKLIQQLLKEDGRYAEAIDGVIGSQTASALTHYPDIDQNWSTPRKAIAFLQIKIKGKGIDPGEIDGYWGHITEYATEQFYQLRTTGKVEPDWRPDESAIANPNQWPQQYTQEFDQFFGPKGESNLVSLDLPYKHFLSWNTAQSVSKIKCHAKVKGSLGKVLQRVLQHYGEEEIKRLRLNIWGGCFSDRIVRGGQNLPCIVGALPWIMTLIITD